jgi:hypothetical protein
MQHYSDGEGFLVCVSLLFVWKGRADKKHFTTRDPLRKRQEPQAAASI